MPTLNLTTTLSDDSRCLVANVDKEVWDNASTTGIWNLRTADDERRMWERLYIGDHVVLLCPHGRRFHLLAASVSDKTLDLNIPKRDRPLQLALHVRGSATVGALPLYGYRSRSDLWCLRPAFASLWELCETKLDTQPQEFRRYFTTQDDRGVRVASSLPDLDYIGTFAQTHSFGYREAYVTLICDKANEPEGALLIEPSTAHPYPHASSIQLFGRDYRDFQSESMSIVRIYTGSRSRNKIATQETLLRAATEIAPFLLEGDLRLLEAVSYDFHPLALPLCFNVEPPKRVTMATLIKSTHA